MTITCVRMVEKLLAAVKRDGLTATPSSRPSSKHDEGNRRRVGVQEALEALDEGELLLVEGGDGGRGRGQNLLELLLAQAVPLETLRSWLPRPVSRLFGDLFDLGARARFAASAGLSVVRAD